MRQPSDRRAARIAQRNPLLTGIALIVIGLLAFAGNLTQSKLLGLLLLTGLGLAFLIWGLAGRKAGLLLTGSLLTALGAGLILALDVLPETSTGGVVTLALGIGFLGVPPLTKLSTGKSHLWAAIPGLLLAFVGAALLAGGPARELLRLSGTVIWPALLVVAGVALLLGNWQRGDRHTRRDVNAPIPPSL